MKSSSLEIFLKQQVVLLGTFNVVKVCKDSALAFDFMRAHEGKKQLIPLFNQMLQAIDSFNHSTGLLCII